LKLDKKGKLDKDSTNIESCISGVVVEISSYLKYAVNEKYVVVKTFDYSSLVNSL